MKYKNLSRLAQVFELILGSSSPRRKHLLEEQKILFKQLIPDIEEIQNSLEPPYDFAVRLAGEKAVLQSSKLNQKQLVIGCDTIVVLGNTVLGKPTDEKIAHQTLSKLSGKSHFVCTAIAIADRNGLLKSGYELTKVFFNDISSNQISDYIKTKEPMDKAGAYGIQGMGAFLVDRIKGNLDNVIGLPLDLLEKLSREILTAQNNGNSNSDQ